PVHGREFQRFRTRSLIPSLFRQLVCTGPPESHNAGPDVTKSGSQHGGRDASPAYPIFLPSDLSSRKRLAQPSLTVCRPLPSASASAGTSPVITEPEPT